MNLIFFFRRYLFSGDIRIHEIFVFRDTRLHDVHLAKQMFPEGININSPG